MSEVYGVVVNSEELKHYGVLGMKWGVRKNPTKAAAKAEKKLSKMDKKVQKLRGKSDKIMEKYYDKEAKAQTSLIFQKRKLRSAGKTAKKAAIKAAKANRAEYKAAKYAKKVENAFSKSSMSFAKDSEIGKKYVSKGVAELAANSRNISDFLNGSRNSFAAVKNYQALTDQFNRNDNNYSTVDYRFMRTRDRKVRSVTS